MRIKLNKIPADKKELDQLLQDIYITAKKNYENQIQSNFTGILEVIASTPNIMEAIRRAGENRRINEPFKKNHDEVTEIVRTRLYDYHPEKMQEVWIPEAGRMESRPAAGITATDQIIRECIKGILEPVAEAQFSEHSYGMRPMRSADMAVAQIRQMSLEGKFWAVKGEIKELYAHIDHNVMISSLWGIGIRDKRVLSIMKQMLKTGILKERRHHMPGAFQTDIAMLLANIYLTRFDGHFREFSYVRYAGQWVILTESAEEAERIRRKAKRCLCDDLHLQLTEENIQITDMRRQVLKFLKLEIAMGRKNGQWLCRIMPEKEELRRQIRKLACEVFRVGKTCGDDEERLILNIVMANIMLTKFMNDYSMCEKGSAACRSDIWMLRCTAYRTLRNHGGRWIRAQESANLMGLHHARRTCISAVKYKGMYIGITDIAFTGWREAECKDQRETPYTPEGRKLYDKRMQKRGLRALADEVNLSSHALAVGMSGNPLYDMEYFMNRACAYKRDRGRCRICGGYVRPEEARILHVDRQLSADRINKTENLITVHRCCRKLIHSNSEPKEVSDKRITD